jgi:hypothetical protein
MLTFEHTPCVNIWLKVLYILGPLSYQTFICIPLIPYYNLDEMSVLL